MTFSDLAAEIKKLPPEELRIDSAGLFECVFDTKFFDPLTSALEDFFGPALKPAGQNPARDLNRYCGEFGGVWKNQTLYYAEHEGISYCALIWPWGDEARATLKIFSIKAKIVPPASSFVSVWEKITENIRSIFSGR